MIELLVRRPDGSVASLRTDRARILLGTDPTADVCYAGHPNTGVSHIHAIIEFEPALGGGWYVLKDKSRNGTLVHGRPLEGPHFLRDGDLIQLGREVGPQVTVRLHVPLDEWRAGQSHLPRPMLALAAALVGVLLLLVLGVWLFLP